MIEIKKYNKNNQQSWDNFLTRSRIDTFLFQRDFLDYHSDRFEDHSFMVFRKGKLEAVLPGNIKGSIFYSHEGLTYGGLVTSLKMTLTDIIETFDLINAELYKNGIQKVIYKPTPSIYHLVPSQEDIYALYRLGAIKIGCNISSTIIQTNKIPFTESRKSGIRKALKENIIVSESNNFNVFWNILNSNLIDNYGKKAVHSLEEILLLKKYFPENIKLYTASKEESIIGGCLLFIMKNIIHVQYISANEEGKRDGALDLLFNFLINEKYKNHLIFDFGQSTEQMGTFLNEKLIFQKQGFGGRGIVYDIYSYKL